MPFHRLVARQQNGFLIRKLSNKLFLLTSSFFFIFFSDYSFDILARR